MFLRGHPGLHIPEQRGDFQAWAPPGGCLPGNKGVSGGTFPPPHAPLQVPPPTQGAALQLAVSMVKVRWFPWQQHGSACFLGDEEGEAARLRASVPYPTPTLQRSHSGLPGLGPCVTIMTVLQVIDSIQASRPLFCLGSGCRLAWFGHIISPFGLSVASSVKWS